MADGCSTGLVDIVSKLIGTIGGIIGVASGVISYRREKHTKKEENERWELLSTFAQAAGKHTGGRLAYVPPSGSKEHKLAEQLVEKGMLIRSPMGGYWLPDS